MMTERKDLYAHMTFREVRRACDLGILRAAVLMGITKNTVWRWERYEEGKSGGMKPPPYAKAALVHLVKCKPVRIRRRAIKDEKEERLRLQMIAQDNR